jgi:hypothetical protein
MRSETAVKALPIEVQAMLKIEAELDAVRAQMGEEACARIEAQVRVLTDCIIVQQKALRDMTVGVMAQIAGGA